MKKRKRTRKVKGVAWASLAKAVMAQSHKVAGLHLWQAKTGVPGGSLDSYIVLLVTTRALDVRVGMAKALRVLKAGSGSHPVKTIFSVEYVGTLDA